MNTGEIFFIYWIGSTANGKTRIGRLGDKKSMHKKETMEQVITSDRMSNKRGSRVTEEDVQSNNISDHFPKVILAFRKVKPEKAMFLSIDLPANHHSFRLSGVVPSYRRHLRYHFTLSSAVDPMIRTNICGASRFDFCMRHDLGTNRLLNRSSPHKTQQTK